MHHHYTITTVLLLLAATGFAIAGCAGPGEPEADTSAQTTPTLERSRRAALAAIGALPGVSEVELVLTPEPGAAGAAHAAVAVQLTDVAELTDALAGSIVRQVTDRFDGLPPHHVAVHNADDPAYLYMGGVGVIE
ncbi:MAG: hypothetical protein WD009_11475 [Phycisphaeraceae bacterium]